MSTATTPVDNSGMNHLGGWDFLDSNVIKFINELLDYNLAGTGGVIDEIKSIAAIFLLMILSYKAYKGMMGDYEVFDIVELGKPFILILIITNWSSFLEIIMFPMDLIEDSFLANLQSQTTEIELGIAKRNDYINQIITKATEVSMDLEAEKESQESEGLIDDLLSSVGDSLTDFGSFAADMYLTIIAKLQYTLTAIVEWLVMLIFQVCVYGVYILRAIFCSILGLLGPLAFAFSILPAFRTAYVGWIGKFVSTYLYGAMTFIVLKCALALVQVGLESELDYLEGTLEDPTAVAIFVTQANPQVGAYLIALLIGAVSIGCVPAMGNWIIPGSSISGAVNKFTSNTAGIVAKAGKAVAGAV
jgi:hypothetical protein